MHEAVADILYLSPQQRSQRIPSGQLVYKNRCGWAHDRLRRAGFSGSPRRGLWKLSPAGHEFAENHPGPLPRPTLERLAFPRRNQSDGEPPLESETPIPQEPREQLEAALTQLRDSVAANLLERLSQVSPTQFEHIVLELLHKMGYGAHRDDVQRTGGSGDGGIDGIIHLDKLGFEKVYIQAKRWQGPVGRKDIQAFYGALAGRRATRGVFLTTSTFTKQAEEYAAGAESIVLVQGRRLAQLMIDHEVGVSLKPRYIPELDGDYFEQL